jgi:hypothetical protein
VKIARSHLEKLREHVAKIKDNKKIRFITSTNPDQEEDKEDEILIVMKIT